MGGKKNWKIDHNPAFEMYIVKREQRDKKNRFSMFEMELKNGVDVSFSDIKKSEGHRRIVMMVAQH